MTEITEAEIETVARAICKAHGLIPESMADVLLVIWWCGPHADRRISCHQGNVPGRDSGGAGRSADRPQGGDG